MVRFSFSSHISYSMQQDMGPKVARNRKVMSRAFGKRLRAARISVGYDDPKGAGAFAAKLGVKTPTYRSYERGDFMPPVHILDLICELTDKSADFLLFGRTDRAATGTARPSR